MSQEMLAQILAELQAVRLELGEVRGKLEQLAIAPAPSPVLESLLAGQAARRAREQAPPVEEPVAPPPEPEPALPEECPACEGGLIRESASTAYCPTCDRTVQAT